MGQFHITRVKEKTGPSGVEEGLFVSIDGRDQSSKSFHWSVEARA